MDETEIEARARAAGLDLVLEHNREDLRKAAEQVAAQLKVLNAVDSEGREPWPGMTVAHD